MHTMFPEGLAAAYLCVAEKCMQHGWYRDAIRYAKKALRLDAANETARELLRKADIKLL